MQVHNAFNDPFCVGSLFLQKRGEIFHRRQPQTSLFWPRFGSGFKCIVTKRKLAVLLTLTYYFNPISTGGGVFHPPICFFTCNFFIVKPISPKFGNFS